jgi:UDP-N-acetylglucosamine 2-epimerase (non-hydrolysing)
LENGISVWTVFGTRPEAIKMLPLVKELQAAPDFDVTVCVTAQHREILDKVMSVFGVEADIDLNVMTAGQTLSTLTAKIVMQLDLALALPSKKPDYILVHGDTTTTLAAALVGYYHQIPVGHVEAGLRTYDINSPFPEEGNRQMVRCISDIHFSPTSRTTQTLINELTPPERVIETGNTVIDALKWMEAELESTPALAKDMPAYVSKIKNKYERYILVTGHRRENHGGGFERVCTALREIAESNPNLAIVYPIHPNPKVREPVMAALGGIDNIELIDPQDYAPFIYLMKHSYLILTDSGGVQEEAPSLGKPVLVMRDTTERQEAIEAGTVKLVGTDTAKIVKETSILLHDSDAYAAMGKTQNPYGDGYASKRIVEAIRNSFKNKESK